MGGNVSAPIQCPSNNSIGYNFVNPYTSPPTSKVFTVECGIDHFDTDMGAVYTNGEVLAVGYVMCETLADSVTRHSADLNGCMNQCALTGGCLAVSWVSNSSSSFVDGTLADEDTRYLALLKVRAT